MRRVLPLSVIAVLGCGAVSDALAQGTLSTQGFGYPPGQVSTRARGTGGGLSEFDPDSPINPSAIGLSADPRMFLQYEPEFRRLTMGSATSNALTARFPVAGASVPIASRGSIGLSVSTFLDRSSSTATSDEREIAGQTVTVTETTRILGAINDVRLAVGYAVSSRIQLGVAGHVYPGQNRVFFDQQFPDSLSFNPVSQISTLGFTGFAASAGLIVRPSRIIGIAVSARKGMSVEAKSGDSVVSEASIPDRFGAGVSYQGIPGSSIAAFVSRDMWSSMNGLGAAGAAQAVDTWSGGLGLETLGPRIVQRQTVIRLGARYRTLPYLASGSEVNELAFGGGLGAQFFRNRATFDLSFERASRKPDVSTVDASERAYTLSVGLRVRP